MSSFDRLNQTFASLGLNYAALPIEIKIRLSVFRDALQHETQHGSNELKKKYIKLGMQLDKEWFLNKAHTIA
jgi:hypothetical protein